MRGLHCDYCIHGLAKHIECHRHHMVSVQEHCCLTIPQEAFPQGATTLYKVFEAQRKMDVSEWMNSQDNVISQRPLSNPQIVLLEDDDYIAHYGHITQMIFIPAPGLSPKVPVSDKEAACNVRVKVPGFGGRDFESTLTFKAGDAIILQGGQKISAWRYNGRSPNGVCVITTIHDLLSYKAFERVVRTDRWLLPTKIVK